MLGDETGERLDGDLFQRADVIDAEVLAAIEHEHDAVDEVVDEHERPRLRAGALDRERDRVGRMRLQRLACARRIAG